MKKLAIVISSKNNYEMLEKEVLTNNKLEGFSLINVDDNSETSQIKLGKKICEKNNIIFLHNKNKGIQWAIQTAIDTLGDEIEWIISIQHDCYPLSENFYSRINKLIL